MISKTDEQAGAHLKQLLNCDERRKQKRLQVKVPIKVKGSDADGNRFEDQTETLNISSSGVAFFLKRRVRVSSLLVLSLSHPDNPGTFNTKGRVVRVEDCAAGHVCKIGVKFEPKS
jgi:hypothetical protein